MIEIVTPDIAFLYRDKLDAMHRLRHRVFKERLGWDVNSRGGLERDVYDLLRPIYLLASNEAGEVQGCWRLLPTTGPNMLRDVFPELLDGAAPPAHPQVWETSRLAVEGGEDGGDRRASVNQVTSELFAGLFEWALLFDIREIVSVYDIRVGRLLGRLGLSPRWTTPRRRIGQTIAVAGGFEVSDAVLAAIREAGGIADSVLVNRNLAEVQNAA